MSDQLFATEHVRSVATAARPRSHWQHDDPAGDRHAEEYSEPRHPRDRKVRYPRTRLDDDSASNWTQYFLLCYRFRLRNPWSCNNEMYEIQSMLKDMNVVFKKVCNEKKLPQKPRIPHKFEKMIALDAAPTASTGKSGRLLAKIKNRRKSSNGKTTTQLCAPRLVTTSKVGDYSGSGLEDVSAYWFVAIGFLLGSSLGTVATYLWLAKTITRSLTSLRRRTTRSGSSTIADQRVNLLDNLWRSSVEDTSRPTTGCPGTPPPPYRDVMLHARRYPRPHIGSVLFADDRAALNERQVHS